MITSSSTEPGTNDVIEAGSIENIRDLSFREDHHRAQTSRWLAFAIVLLLAASVAAHYVAVMYLSINNYLSAVASLESIFQVWLPVISGLASAAVTYYFTRQNT